MLFISLMAICLSASAQNLQLAKERKIDIAAEMKTTVTPDNSRW